MESFLERSKLEEIFYGDETVASFQEYAEQVRLLHHRYLQLQLTEDRYSNNGEIDINELFRFAEDAEYLATKYTNPLVIERIEGLPVESVPPRQVVQDALSLCGTIYEFLGDILQWYEEQEKSHTGSSHAEGEQHTGEDESSNYVNAFRQSVGGSKMVYLKSALCYSLGYYEPRTSVILQRLLKRLDHPAEELSIANHRQWADFLICTLLARKLDEISSTREQTAEQVETISQYLLTAVESSPGSKKTLSQQTINEITISQHLVKTCLVSEQAFTNGSADLMNDAYNHLSRAIMSTNRSYDYELLWILRRLRDVLERMWNNSPWQRLGKIIPRRTYLRTLVRDGIVTLWTSQQAALDMRSRIGELQGGFLDERIRRVVIHMPTSAGKTLLAELAIAQFLFTNPEGKCVYVAPSRALCDQVLSDLAARLTRFGIRITAVVSDQDIIDEYEGVLFGRTNAIIVTPEKLSYLFRQQSSFIFESSLFIFDELHAISRLSGGRGWTYEEIISLLLQHAQTTEAKMLFLSAVMPNHVAVQEWVDPEKTGEPLNELWQPTRLLKGVVTFQGSRRRPKVDEREVSLPGDLLYVRSREELVSPLRISNFIQSRQVPDLKKTQESRQWKRDTKNSDNHIVHAAKAAIKLERLGPVLVYAPKVDQTEQICNQIIQMSSNMPTTRYSRYDEVIEFVRHRLPAGHALLEALVRGVAFHNAALPTDVRNEIEHAFRQGWIRILTATTTLVEGVNFPVKTLIISDYCWSRTFDGKKKEWKEPIALEKQDFRNIAGRAGRALHETEGQVVFIEAINGYPYPTRDDRYLDYIGVNPNSRDLEITSSLEKKEVLDKLSVLVDEVDNGTLSQEQLLAETGSNVDKDTMNLVNKLQTFALLVQEREMTDELEDRFVQLMQRTFLGQRRPNDAPQIVGAFIHRTARAVRASIDAEERNLFSQTGLRIVTCRTLWQNVHTFWNEHQELLTGSPSVLSRSLLLDIASTIFDLNDTSVDPQLIKSGPRKKERRLEDDRAFFADWILEHDTNSLLDQHFDFIKDKSWRATQYVHYTQQTMAYRLPWTLSAFWLFSKAIVAKRFSIELTSLPIGKELALVPAYAKFGVHSPAAALFSTLGISPAILARELGQLYSREENIGRYDYPDMLQWLLSIDLLDLEAHGVEPSFIRRLVRLLDRIKPLEDEDLVEYRENTWEARFFIAGWRYYQGESVLNALRRGDRLDLRLDRNNTYDPNAVAVLRENVQLGYVPRYLSRDVAEQVRIQSVEAIIMSINPGAPMHEKVRVRCVVYDG
jgi:hypothetical protein